MNPIHRVIENTTVGEAVTHETLSVFPLLVEEPFAKDYLTLDEALAAGTGTITEVSESGSVPELLFRNTGHQAVFLLDGEELVGAKQNRVLNITILAPAHKDTVIPVSCVEAGRWHHTRDDFASAPRAQSPSSTSCTSTSGAEAPAVNPTRVTSFSQSDWISEASSIKYVFQKEQLLMVTN